MRAVLFGSCGKIARWRWRRRRKRGAGRVVMIVGSLIADRGLPRAPADDAAGRALPGSIAPRADPLPRPLMARADKVAAHSRRYCDAGEASHRDSDRRALDESFGARAEATSTGIMRRTMAASGNILQINSPMTSGFRVELNARPRRIISLVPSWTETLFALGLGNRSRRRDQVLRRAGRRRSRRLRKSAAPRIPTCARSRSWSPIWSSPTPRRTGARTSSGCARAGYRGVHHLSAHGAGRGRIDPASSARALGTRARGRRAGARDRAATSAASKRRSAYGPSCRCASSVRSGKSPGWRSTPILTRMTCCGCSATTTSLRPRASAIRSPRSSRGDRAAARYRAAARRAV